jgi:hypothetical protein
LVSENKKKEAEFKVMPPRFLLDGNLLNQLYRMKEGICLELTKVESSFSR